MSHVAHFGTTIKYRISILVAPFISILPFLSLQLLLVRIIGSTTDGARGTAYQGTLAGITAQRADSGTSGGTTNGAGRSTRGRGRAATSQ